MGGLVSSNSRRHVIQRLSKNKETKTTGNLKIFLITVNKEIEEIACRILKSTNENIKEAQGNK